MRIGLRLSTRTDVAVDGCRVPHRLDAPDGALVVRGRLVVRVGLVEHHDGVPDVQREADQVDKPEPLCACRGPPRVAEALQQSQRIQNHGACRFLSTLSHLGCVVSPVFLSMPLRAASSISDCRGSGWAAHSRPGCQTREGFGFLVVPVKHPARPPVWPDRPVGEAQRHLLVEGLFLRSSDIAPTGTSLLGGKPAALSAEGLSPAARPPADKDSRSQ